MRTEHVKCRLVLCGIAFGHPEVNPCTVDVGDAADVESADAKEACCVIGGIRVAVAVSTPVRMLLLNDRKRICPVAFSQLVPAVISRFVSLRIPQIEYKLQRICSI